MSGVIRPKATVWLVAAVLGMIFGAVSEAQVTRGRLFIIGGGKRPPEMMRQYLDFAGGEGHARIIVIPNASSEPETTGTEQAEQFTRLGAASASCLYLRREEAMKESSAHLLDGATGIFFSGGDQSLLTRDLLHTPVHRKIHELYATGAVIGGTSAGAAVMSEVMITGDETLNLDSTNAFVFIRRGNIVTTEGFGFVKTMIVDQHFLRRKRYARLISVVLEHPKLVGVGIDEATAVVVQPDSILSVTGEGSVLILDARGAGESRTDTRGNLSIAGVSMHLLVPGDRYDARTGVVVPGRDKK
jgi:cyanophycinase